MSFVVKGNSYGLFEKQVLIPDGVADTFVLNYRPGLPGAILVVYDGVIQEPASSYNLVNNGKSIKFTFIPVGGTSVFIIYLGRELAIPTVVGNHPLHDQAIGDGATTTFNLSATPAEPALMVYIDGILKNSTTDWALNTNQVVFAVAPAVDAKIDFYIHGIERTDLVTVDDESITAAKLNLHYIFYEPGLFTFSGMSHNDPVFEVAKYLPCGSFVRLRLLFTVTFGDVPKEIVRITLPEGYDNDGTGLVTGNVTLRTDSILESGIIQWGSTTSIDIKRPDGIDYTINDEWTFEISMEYDLA